MTVLFWSAAKTEAESLLCGIVESVSAGRVVESLPDLEALARRLRRPGADEVAVVLLAGTREALEALLSMEEFLRDRKIILVLPDHDKETVALGHRLGPRFLTYLDSDLSDVGAVLTRMIKHHNYEKALKAFEQSDNHL
ncbi:MAG: hypothetical protein AB1896_17855 [Thermodesulfobacteriota bacterium]